MRADDPAIREKDKKLSRFISRAVDDACRATVEVKLRGRGIDFVMIDDLKLDFKVEKEKTYDSIMVELESL